VIICNFSLRYAPSPNGSSTRGAKRLGRQPGRLVASAGVVGGLASSAMTGAHAMLFTTNADAERGVLPRRAQVPVRGRRAADSVGGKPKISQPPPHLKDLAVTHRKRVAARSEGARGRGSSPEEAQLTTREPARAAAW
jgi:hypothetical protein